MNIEIERGLRQYHYANHHACRETGTIWYQHDTAVVVAPTGARLRLKGCLQTAYKRVRFGRIDRKETKLLTSYGGYCVRGYDVDWLVRQQLEEIQAWLSQQNDIASSSAQLPGSPNGSTVAAR